MFWLFCCNKSFNKIYFLYWLDLSAVIPLCVFYPDPHQVSWTGRVLISSRYRDSERQAWYFVHTWASRVSQSDFTPAVRCHESRAGGSYSLWAWRRVSEFLYTIEIKYCCILVLILLHICPQRLGHLIWPPHYAF